MTPQRVRLSVLSSSSAGNSTVLEVAGTPRPRLVLIDAGLSPRATRTRLASLGASDRDLAAVVLTHLDRDHFNAGWLRYLRRGVPIWLHRSHAGRATRDGILYRKSELFDDAFEPVPGLKFSAALLSHDDLGVAVFRVTLPGSNRSLGYATDVGHPSSTLFSHLADVDVLAIESNYCPRLQVASGRPAFLQQRIMGGSGHLSNQQSADAVARIGVRERAILLHLSRQCNTPETAGMAHQSHGVPVTIASHDQPTPWLDLSSPAPLVERPPLVPAGLFA
ncbi:MAG: MBL fold metallo-hydrolase [Phycisphaerales bacterium]|nr:MBL fold metallo-hydrolase [Phycisphaerales bacterium]